MVYPATKEAAALKAADLEEIELDKIKLPLLKASFRLLLPDSLPRLRNMSKKDVIAALLGACPDKPAVAAEVSRLREEQANKQTDKKRKRQQGSSSFEEESDEVNKGVDKGTRLQIRVGTRNWNSGRTLYNATVTEVLNDELVKVRTKDDCPNIAKTESKIVRLTEKQARSGRPCGFTNKKANAGFPVEGAHDD